MSSFSAAAHGGTNMAMLNNAAATRGSRATRRRRDANRAPLTRSSRCLPRADLAWIRQRTHLAYRDHAEPHHYANPTSLKPPTWAPS